MPPREQLLRKVLAYFLKHGVAHLSLRPLAAAVGTSARMLVHHFGSKEGLFTAVLADLQSRLQAAFQPLLERPAGAKPDRIMLDFWRIATSRKYRPYVRLLFEIQILAIQHPARYRRYLSDMSATWIGLIRSALPPGRDNPAMAALCMAVLDGLVLEHLATGDLDQGTKAIELFHDLLRSHG